MAEWKERRYELMDNRAWVLESEAEAKLAVAGGCDSKHCELLLQAEAENERLKAALPPKCETCYRIMPESARPDDCGCNCGNCPCCWAREDAKPARPAAVPFGPDSLGRYGKRRRKA